MTSTKGYRRVSKQHNGHEVYVYVKPDATVEEGQAALTKACAKRDRKVAKAPKVTTSNVDFSADTPNTGV